mgnify:CR=1 FL=1
MLPFFIWMRYRKLGHSGIEVSELSIGAMSFRADQPKVAHDILNYGIEQGINLIDTADLYEHGENEKLIGECIKNRRSDLVIATKVGNRWRDDGSGWDWVPTKDYILKAVDQSLKRLQTDYIDLYQLHGGTIDDPMDEVIEAFEMLIEAGKIRAYGISSIRPNTIRLFTDIGRPTSIMMQYSLLDRRPEEKMLNYLREQSIGVLARGVLAKGLLAAKPATPFLKYTESEVSELQKDMQKQGNIAAIALSFVLKNSALSSALVGFSSLNQIKEIMKAYDEVETLEFPDEIVQVLPPNYDEKHR